MTRAATRLELPAALAAAIRAEARGAAPRECCGLLEGRRDGSTIRVEALHPARNLAADANRFEMDPAAQFAAQKAARSNGSIIVGCYHSHPGGKAEPSAADQAGAQENDFVWLIAGDEDVKAFVYRDGKFAGLGLGADWVTSSP